MAIIDKKKTLKNLKSKGFVESKNRSDDHIYLDFYYGGQLILYTKISHGSTKDITGFLINAMARQCRLSKTEFLNLARCPMDADTFITTLIENGDIDE